MQGLFGSVIDFVPAEVGVEREMVWFHSTLMHKRICLIALTNFMYSVQFMQIYPPQVHDFMCTSRPQNLALPCLIVTVLVLTWLLGTSLNAVHVFFDGTSPLNFSMYTTLHSMGQRPYTDIQWARLGHALRCNYIPSKLNNGHVNHWSVGAKQSNNNS